MIGDVACSQLTRVLFTSHNHNYILSCKHASRPIQARVLSQLFYNSATEPRAFTTAFSVDCLLPLTETYGFNNQNGGVKMYHIAFIVRQIRITQPKFPRQFSYLKQKNQSCANILILAFPSGPMAAHKRHAVS